MECPKCNFKNRNGIKFCEECGAKLELECPACKAKLPLGIKYCGECGHSLKDSREIPAIDYSKPQSYTPKFLADKIFKNRNALEGERKLVTVLFADVANYTSMAERLDPEEVHEIMDGCFNILLDEIHHYEGTINQFTGDGVMALFGAPLSSEDHAQRACYAALSIQKSIKNYGEKIKQNYGLDFKMRIGLNSGIVVVASIGDDLRMDYTAMGDTTNMAARLESLAQPGTTLISASTQRLTRDYFEFKPLGGLEVKGKAEVQEAYKLIRVTEVETRIEAAAAKGLTTFVGRSREMRVLKEAYEKVKTGSGQMVGIVGESGVGKSRILLELRSGLTIGECTYLEGRCINYGGGMVYLPILDILRSYLSIKEGDQEFVINKKLQKKLIQLDGQSNSHIPPLQELLSLKIEDEKYLQLDHGQKKMRIFEGMRDVLIGASQNKPLVIAVDDLHWIDKTSEEFLGYFIDWIANTQILVILLYRPEYTHRWGSKSYYIKVGVNQLSAETSAELVQVILEDGSVVTELKELILGRTSGNPLFVEELTQSLIENDIIQKKDNKYVLTCKPSEIHVPETIQGIIAARIDRVEENLKRVMQVASVIGREFAFRILQSIMGVTEELKSQLLNLQGLEFISEKNLFPELEYVFKHALTQEVAYSSLLQKRKKEIHAKIGAAIESLYPNRLEEYYELLAYHYERSVNFEKAWEYLNLANQKAAKLNAMEDAKVYFDQAMQLLDKLPDSKKNQMRRISIIISNFDVFDLLFKLPEYTKILNCYKQMLEGFETSELLSVFYAMLGYCECAMGKIDNAIQTGMKAIKVCDPKTNLDHTIFSYVALQWSYLWKADFDRVLTLKNDLIHLLKGNFNLRWYMYALTGASITYRNMGYWNEAISEAEKAIKIGEKFSDNSVVSFAAMTLSSAYLRKYDLSRALEYGEYAVDRAPTPGNKAWAQSWLATVWCRTDDIDKGIQILSSTVQMYQAVNWTLGVIQAKSLLGEGYWLDEKYDKSKQILEESVELAGQCGSRFYLGVGYRILGEIARVTTPNQSLALFEKSISIFEEINAENEMALSYGGCGRLYKQQHRIEKARKYLTKSLKILERLGTLIQPDIIKMELSELPET